MTTSELIRTVTEGWVADDAGDVVWAGDHDGRRGVRMRQAVRDMTTVWFGVGQRTVSIEAFVLPAPPQGAEDVYRLALARNLTVRRVRFSLDAHGDLVLTGKIPIAEVSEEELELVLGEVYDLIEVTFPAFVAAAFGREKKAP